MKIKEEFMFFCGAFVSYFSFFGSFPFWTMTSIFLLIIGMKTFAVTFALASLITMLVEHTIKYFFKIKRPDFNSVKPVSIYQKFQQSTSFPSGHVANIALFTTMLNLNFHNILLTSLFSIIAILVGFSRIYTKRHYFKDVIAGYLIGITLGVLSFALF